MQVPSGYFFADSYLYLDLLLNKKLFKPKPAKDGKPPLTRADMAAIEGVKAKKLLGALRYLWRSSKEGGHDPRVVELKQYVKSSPKKPPRQVVH